MEKRKPTYQLTEVKRLVLEEQWKIATSAKRTIDALGFSQADIQTILLELSPKDFYKSMTEYAHSTAWQDVYKKTAGLARLYLKQDLRITPLSPPVNGGKFAKNCVKALPPACGGRKGVMRKSC